MNAEHDEGARTDKSLEARVPAAQRGRSVSLCAAKVLCITSEPLPRRRMPSGSRQRNSEVVWRLGGSAAI